MEKGKNIVDQIVDLWCSITGTDLNSKEYTFSVGQEFNLSTAREDLKSTLLLDESGLTTVLLMNSFADAYFCSHKYSLAELLSSNDTIQTRLASCKQLKSLLLSPEIEMAILDFTAKLKTVLDKMNAQEDAFKTLSNPGAMGYLRRDALKSMDTLAVHQFTQGKTTSTYLQPCHDIFLFWNMASAVRLGLKMPDGVFLGLVRDQFDYASFFVLVAKNGGTLTVFTDAEEYVTPLQKTLSRRPERHLSQRIAKHHFPYSLLDTEVDTRGYVHPGREGVVPLQESPIVIGHLKRLAADELLWLLMVFSLIDQKLFKCNWTLPSLSYCSDVFRENSALCGEIENLPTILSYSPIQLPKNTLQTLQADKQYKRSISGEETPWGTMDNAPNQWLLELYQDRVPDSAINGLLKLPSTMLKLAEPGGDITSITKADYENMGPFAQQEFDSQELMAMTGGEFGSKEQLEADYRFLARYNEALCIKMLSDADFKANKPNVFQWIRDRVSQQQAYILSLLVNNAPNSEAWQRYPSIKAYNADSRYHRNELIFSNGSCWTLTDTKCFWNGNIASYAATFHPTSMEELLSFLNCGTVEELPFWLQHWDNKRKYIGNPILERIDPMNWVVTDHWAELSFYFTFFLSKRTFNHACKAHQLPAMWLTPRPDK